MLITRPDLQSFQKNKQVNWGMEFLAQHIRIIRYLVLICAFLPISRKTKAQEFASFIENKGQFPSVVHFKANLPNGAVFFEKGGYTCNLTETLIDQHKGFVSDKLRGHAFRMRLINHAKGNSFSGTEKSDGFSNYFLGKDYKTWVSSVSSFRKIIHKDIYKGIDWEVYFSPKGIKYDFVIMPQSSPDEIAMQYEGAEDLFIRRGALHIQTSIGTVMEEKPNAWQLIDGKKIPVACKFKLDDSAVRFVCGKYNPAYPLIIDPQLVFGTYSGSSSDNWGFTATHDNNGNAYSAGVVFGTGYPASTGAYQINFNGGQGSKPVDIGISKYDANGKRLYSTYLGGNGNELPQSLVVSSNNELFILGTTGSSDFPVTPGAWSRNFSGGKDISILSNVLKFPSGTDMFISRLSEDGSKMLASTYLGGTDNDGLNISPFLRYNYADDARGAVIIDELNNVYIGASSASADFPTTAGAFQPDFGGGLQDGIIAKFNMNLTDLIWCSFLGGESADGVFSLTLDGKGKVFLTGGTASPDFPVINGNYQEQKGGGLADGFIAGITPNGKTLFASTYYGSELYDQSYLIATNRSNEIYVYGQTEKDGSFYLSQFSWNQPNGKQFISKFDNGLTKRIWSTTFGTGKKKPDITPSAFTVDICGQMFLCGWGGSSNVAPDGNPFGGTSGLITTADAFQKTTDNNDFYLMVIHEKNQSLVYATFFGGGISNEHVDGGTSRFDRRGVIYQSVCAGCGGHDDFPTTPGVWSNLNGSSNGCNNAVFKFDFQLPATVASFNAPPIGCAPFDVSFQNTTTNATSFIWKQNGQIFSTEKNPAFVFNQPGSYIVELTASNPNSCNVQDTFRKIIHVVNSTRDIQDTIKMCYLDSILIGPKFIADPYYTASWKPEKWLENPAAQQTLATPENSLSYRLLLSLGSCSDTIDQHISVKTDVFDAGPDLQVCKGQKIQIGQSGDTKKYAYAWMPSALLDSANTPDPLADINGTTRFVLLRSPLDDTPGCPGRDSLKVTVPDGSPAAAFEVLIKPACNEIYVQVEDKSELADTIIWDFGKGKYNGSKNPVITYQYGDSIAIIQIVANSVCSDTLGLVKSVKGLSEYLLIQDVNTFTPDQDGKNDCFSPALQNLSPPDDKAFIACSSLRIYDRWGSLIFESMQSPSGCWDGSDMDGREMPGGTYFFLFELQDKKRQGLVYLIR